MQRKPEHAVQMNRSPSTAPLAGAIALALRAPARPRTGRRRAPAALLATTLVLSCTVALPARADDWTGVASSDWFNAANWLDGSVPTAGDTVVIDTVAPNPTTIGGGASTVSTLNVGLFGTADLAISGGGALTVVSGVNIGRETGSQGAIAVTGAGSSLDYGSLLNVGTSGEATLSVIGGGLLQGAGRSAIGVIDGSQGSVTISGAGSRWTSPAGSDVGFDGTGSLSILDGGTVGVSDVGVGTFDDGQGDLTVDGSGSILDVANNLTVGAGGTGTLAISNGGTASAGEISLGLEIESQGTLDVSGANSSVTSNTTVTVGVSGNGNLRIANGATLTSLGGPQSLVGLNAGATGSAVVTGTGSRWTANSALIVGRSGNGALTISDGGVVDSALGVIGDLAGGEGTAMVTGAGSSWNNTGVLFVGNFGQGTLFVTGGGSVTSNVASLGGGADAQGAASVLGVGSRWDIADALNVGNFGTAALTIGNGGAVSSALGRIGLSAGGEGTVTVTGAGSNWVSDGSLTVGVAGTGQLIIDAAGAVSAGTISLGELSGSQGTVSVSGAGTSLVANELVMGSGGDATLSIAGGGRAEFATTQIGLGGGVAALRVSGVDSTLINSGSVLIGQGGSRGELLVSAAGGVEAGQLFVGYSGANDAVLARFTGAGSSLDAGNLFVGHLGTGRMELLDGSDANVTLASIGNGTDGVGMLTVSNSTLSASDGLVIGSQGSGILAISGGAVSSGDLSLGVQAGAAGRVEMTGGSTLASDTMVVGDAGIGIMLVGGGSTIETGSLTIAQQAGSTGYLAIGSADADLPIAPGFVLAPSVVFGAGDGTLAFNHTSTDYHFDLPILGNGTLLHDAGTTILGGASTASGTALIEGGTLLVEGTLGDMATTVFGGTLGGSGSIAGDVTVLDGATLAPGSSAGTLTVGSLALSGGSILDYELGQAGVIGSGVNDLIEIGGNLTLDGTLDITDIGGFGVGVYRLMNYGGALTDNSLDIGTLPTGFNAQDLFVQTGIAGQVNLVNSTGLVLSFWDGSVATEHNNGAVNDGDGTWDANNDNWTAADGAVNGRWDDGTFAVFSGAGGAGGTVSVVGEQGVAGVQFMAGYTLNAGADGALRIDGAGSVIRVDPTITATIAAPIVGAGGLVKTDTGTLVLSATNAYTGGTAIDRGTLQVASDANLGAAAGALSFDGGTLRNTGAFNLSRAVTLEAGGGTFDTAANLGIDNVIAGTGALTKTGAGTLTLTGTNTYTGGTRVQAGTMIGDVDAIRGDLINDGTVVFDQGADATFGGAISGSGAMVKRGAGALTLGGSSALDWSIDAGALIARAAQFSGDAAIAGGATLHFNEATGSYAGALSGAGRFEIAGGTTPFALTGNSAAFSGSTFLQTGTLRIDGSLGGLTTLAAGTTLSGTGSLGSVDNAGTVAAGNSIGTLTLTGDYTHRADATLLAEIAPGGGSDLLDVAGSATLEGGAVEVIKAPGQYAGGTRYTLIDAAGGVTGSFATLDQDLPFLDLALAYDANHAYLDVVRNAVDFDIVCGQGTFNQCQVADTLDAIGDGQTITPDFETVLTEVTTLSLDQARAGFDRLSGEAHASFAGVMLEGHALYGQTVTRRIAERREAVGAQQLQGGVWARAYGMGSELDGDGNAHGADVDLHGAAFGVDAWGTEHWLIGASFNAMRVDADFRAGDGGEADAKNVSLYTSVHGERAYLDGVLSFAWWDSEVQRRIDIGSLNRQASSDYDSNRLALYLEGGWNIDLGSSRLQPLISVQRDRLDTQNFRESGAQDLDLIGRSQSTTRTTASAGLRWTGGFARDGWTLEPSAQLRWLHSTGDLTPQFEVAFAGAPDTAYRVHGVSWPEDRGLIGIGLNARRGDRFDLFVDYDYQQGGGLEAHNLSAGLRYRW